MQINEIDKFYQTYNENYKNAVKLEMNLKHACSNKDFLFNINTIIPQLTSIFFTLENDLKRIVCPILNHLIPLDKELAKCFLRNNYQQTQESIPAPLLHFELNDLLIEYFNKNNDKDSETLAIFDYATNLSTFPLIYNNLNCIEIEKRTIKTMDLLAKVSREIINYPSYSEETQKAIIKSLYIYISLVSSQKINKQDFYNHPELPVLINLRNAVFEDNHIQLEENSNSQIYAKLLSVSVAVSCPYKINDQLQHAKETLDYLREDNPNSVLIFYYDILKTKDPLGYKKIIDRLDKYKNLAQTLVEEERGCTYKETYNSFVLHFAFFDSLDFADITIEEKHALLDKFAKEYQDSLRKIVSANISNLNLQEGWTKLGRIATALTHWKEEDLIRYIINIASYHLIFTVVHSCSVSAISKTIAKALIKNNPEYFVKYGLFSSVEEVKANIAFILSYTENAGVIHDIGKFPLVAYYGQPFLPFSKSAYQSLTKHCELGASFLAKIPRLENYTEVALYHHRHFNDVNGYPKDGSLTNSKYRSIIYIISLADCLDAATDNISRFYKPRKTFDTVMDEFRAARETQFAPEVIEVIEKDKELQKKLKSLTSEKRYTDKHTKMTYNTNSFFK